MYSITLLRICIQYYNPREFHGMTGTGLVRSILSHFSWKMVEYCISSIYRFLNKCVSHNGVFVPVGVRHSETSLRQPIDTHSHSEALIPFPPMDLPRDPQLANDPALSVFSRRAEVSLVELPTTDDPSLEAVLRVSLEDAVERGEHIQGKAREDAPLTAEQLAIQLHVAELEAALRSTLDTRFARSLERAIDEDAQMIQFFQEVEQHEHEDRVFALRMSQRASSRMDSRVSTHPEEATTSAVHVLRHVPPVERWTEVSST